MHPDTPRFHACYPGTLASPPLGPGWVFLDERVQLVRSALLGVRIGAQASVLPKSTCASLLDSQAVRPAQASATGWKQGLWGQAAREMKAEGGRKGPSTQRARGSNQGSCWLVPTCRVVGTLGPLCQPQSTPGARGLGTSCLALCHHPTARLPQFQALRGERVKSKRPTMSFPF